MSFLSTSPFFSGKLLNDTGPQLPVSTLIGFIQVLGIITKGRELLDLSQLVIFLDKKYHIVIVGRKKPKCK